MARAMLVILGTVWGFSSELTESLDTEIRSNIPDAAFGRDATFIIVATAVNTITSQALMRFELDGITSVTDARLEVGTIFGTTATIIGYRMLVPWDENATWNGFANDGVQIDGTEARTEPSFQIVAPVFAQTQTVDVTNDVQAWLGGAPNYGWVFAMNNTGGLWAFNAFEAQLLSPTLLLTSDDPLPTHSPTPDPGTDTVEILNSVDAEIRSDTPDTPLVDAPSIRIVRSEDLVTQGLLWFNVSSLAGRSVAQASLEILPSTVGFQGTIRGYKMLQAWSEPTWDSFTNGVQPDGAEAAATASFEYVAPMGGTIEVTDVTADIQAWVNDQEPNYGWLLQIDEGIIDVRSLLFTTDESGLFPPLLDVKLVRLDDTGSQGNSKKKKSSNNTTMIVIIVVVVVIVVVACIAGVAFMLVRKKESAPAEKDDGTEMVIEASAAENKVV